MTDVEMVYRSLAVVYSHFLMSLKQWEKGQTYHRLFIQLYALHFMLVSYYIRETDY